MLLEQFFDYLKNEKKMAKNTLEAYKRDVLEFAAFEEARGISDLRQTQGTEVVAFLLKLKNTGKSAATVNRKLASVRAFYNYLQAREEIHENPAHNIKSPKIERKELEFLTMEETNRLLALPDKSLKGARDSAVLELLYATGIRVSELIDTNVEDINLRMGFITCAADQRRARIIPIGRPARAALENYIYEAREQLLRGNKEEPALFVNYHGQRITRQGLWKILKEYGKKAGLEEKLTPNIIRNSFAVHMLQNGAEKVYAVDVGYNQLDYRLRTHPKVVCMERTNARYLTREQIPEPLDFFSVDVSFISLNLIFPAVRPLMREGGEGVCLIKPQFEAGKDKVGKKGVVRDASVHLEVLEHFLEHAAHGGFTVKDITFSPIRGPEGNIEYLGYLSTQPGPAYGGDLKALVEASHELDKGDRA